MKTLSTALTLTVITLSAIADEKPADLVRLQKAHSDKIQNVNKQYVEALKRIKKKYMMGDDLESAVAVDKEIKKYQTNLSINLSNHSSNKKIPNSITNVAWTWRHTTDKGSWFILENNGTGKFFPGGTGLFQVKWKQLDDHSISMHIHHYKQPAKIKWDKNFSTFTGTDVDQKRKVSGKLKAEESSKSSNSTKKSTLFGR